ncbi:hypothetical protein N665_0342s0006 [Sinapis alba]|nr:hypothetical protein N665_0342s0006 [Sinapis alba]
MIFFSLGFGNICSSIGIGRLKSLKHITLKDLNVSLLDVLGCKRLPYLLTVVVVADPKFTAVASDYSLELPKRIFTLGEEPFPIKSIEYHTDDSKLFSVVRDVLHDDEYKELKESRLRVFLKFKEMDFGWASRLVHYMLCFQLNIKKKYELWSLVGADPVRFSLIEFEQLTSLNCEYIEHLENPRCEVTNEMAIFWEQIGVSVDAGPSSEHIIRALKRCQEWSRDDRMRLGYLAIFSGFIEGRKYSSTTRASLARLVMDLEKFENYPWGRVALKVLMDSLRAKDFTKSYTVDGFIQVLQVWIYHALPELGANYGNRLPNRPSPPLMAFKGGKGRKYFKDVISRHTRVINYVEKNIEEMFPKWDNDREDVYVENIIQVMFNTPPNWKWTMNCWEDEGIYPWTNPKTHVVYVKDESSVKSLVVREEHIERPSKRTRIEAPAEPRSEDIPDARSGAIPDARSEASIPDGCCGEEAGNHRKRELYAGIVPTFCATNKTWGVDIDELYAPVNFQNDHWIAIWISIPKRHIVVWDSIVKHISKAQLDEIMEPFLTMVPYLLVECVSTDEERIKYSLEPFTYERPTVGVPQCIAGDCGVYALKCMECHALGYILFHAAFCEKNVKHIREKMAHDIFHETPDIEGIEDKTSYYNDLDTYG